MARNVVNDARADANALAGDLSNAGELARKMETHQGTPMYLAEVAAVLKNQNRWDAFTKRVKLGDLENKASHDGDQVNDADKDAGNSHGDQFAIINAVTHNETLYAERFLMALGPRNRRIIQKIDASEGAFRSRAGIALGQAELDGLITGAEVVTLGKQAFSGGLGGDPHPQDILTANAAAVVEKPTSDAKGQLDKAERKLQELDDKLQKELREIGPTIWDPNETDNAKIEAAQKRVNDYIKDFRGSKEYVDAKNNVKKWANALHVQLQQDEANIEGHGTDPHAQGAAAHARDEILDSYHNLAASETKASVAAIWAHQHLDDKRFKAERPRIVQIGQLAQSNDAFHKGQRIAELMRGDGGGHERESRVLKTIEFIEHNVLEPYDVAHGIKGLGELRECLTNLKKHISAFVHPKEIEQVRELGRAMIRVTAHGDVIVQRIGISFGMMVAISEDTEKLRVTTNFVEIGDNVKALYVKVDEVRKLVDRGFGKGSAGKLADEVKQVHGKYLALSRTLGVLSIASGALGIKEDLSEIGDISKNPAIGVKLVGDIATTVGAAIALFPPLAPLGEAISLVGQVISFIAGGFLGNSEAEDRRNDEQSRLVRTHAFGKHNPNAGTLADTFTDDSAAGELEAAQAHGLNLEKIRTLGLRHKFLFKDGGLIDGADRLRHFLADPHNTKHGMGGLVSPYKDDLFKFLMASHDDDNMRLALFHAAHHLDDPDHLIRKTMIGAIRRALPKGAFHDPHGVTPISELP